MTVQSTTVETLLSCKAASRIHAKDFELYNFNETAKKFAQDYMGWTTLASNPPTPIQDIELFAAQSLNRGIKSVYLIGQGGSTQAPMTLTKYNKPDGNSVKFRVLDSDSPVRLRKALHGEDFKNALVIISSKSGGTLEPRMVLSAVRDIMERHLSKEEIPQHLVAITDPGSNLEKQAQEESWLHIFSGEPTVGGRFSGLSVFGLVPAALAGIDLTKLIEQGKLAEEQCSTDTENNPAIQLAAFLYDNYTQGRDKFCFVTSKRGRVLGLWIEQLVAESLGKEGQGILPVLEVNSLHLAPDATKCSCGSHLQMCASDDRSVITYTTKQVLEDDVQNLQKSLDIIDENLPRKDFYVDKVEEIAAHFVMWEYAVAMLGYLMKVSPFDQPDVQSAKTEVVNIIANGLPEPDYYFDFTPDCPLGTAELRKSDNLPSCSTVEEAIDSLIASIKPDDYFVVSAFLPFEGEGRKDALETMRRSVFEKLGVVSTLEIGPRFLHSSGQLYKGGPNKGVFLVISGNEMHDMELHEDCKSMGALAKYQAVGDWRVLADRNRRALHIHVPNNSDTTLRMLATMVEHAVVKALHKK